MRQDICYTEYYCDLCGKKIEKVVKDGKVVQKYMMDVTIKRPCIVLPYLVESFDNEDGTGMHYKYSTTECKDICDDCFEKVYSSIKSLLPEDKKTIIMRNKSLK